MFHCLEQNLDEEPSDVINLFATTHPATPNRRRRPRQEKPLQPTEHTKDNDAE